MQVTLTRADVPAAMVMATLFLIFGLFALLRPEKLRSAMDNLANAWGQDAWHPYRMPIPILRLVVGSVGIGGSVLFLYAAYVGFGR